MTRISLAAFLSACVVFSASAQNAAPVVDGNAYVTSPLQPQPYAPSVIQGQLPPDDISLANPAQLEIRLSNMEDEMRNLRGKNEELGFQIQKLTESMEKMQRDVEMRLSDLEGRKRPVENTMIPAATPEEVPVAIETPFPKTPEGTTGGNGMLKLPDSAEATPRDLYNHAFRLLNQTKYEDAASVFDKFTKQYPKDPLIGNAYYWMGETYYIRRDYVTAADNFRAGFEALPTGPKAPDNLLKLAMSLDALSQDKEACVVLSQIVTKFKKESVSVTDKAQQEQKRIGCK